MRHHERPARYARSIATPANSASRTTASSSSSVNSAASCLSVRQRSPYGCRLTNRGTPRNDRIGGWPAGKPYDLGSLRMSASRSGTGSMISAPRTPRPRGRCSISSLVGSSMPRVRNRTSSVHRQPQAARRDASWGTFEDGGVLTGLIQRADRSAALPQAALIIWTRRRRHRVSTTAPTGNLASDRESINELRPQARSEFRSAGAGAERPAGAARRRPLDTQAGCGPEPREHLRVRVRGSRTSDPSARTRTRGAWKVR